MFVRSIWKASFALAFISILLDALLREEQFTHIGLACLIAGVCFLTIEEAIVFYRQKAKK